MSEKKATLHIEGMDPIELPIYSGSAGPDVIDVRQLVSKGLFTYDPGFVSTASCESKITYIDGKYSYNSSFKYNDKNFLTEKKMWIGEWLSDYSREF